MFCLLNNLTVMDVVQTFFYISSLLIALKALHSWLAQIKLNLIIDTGCALKKYTDSLDELRNPWINDSSQEAKIYTERYKNVIKCRLIVKEKFYKFNLVYKRKSEWVIDINAKLEKIIKEEREIINAIEKKLDPDQKTEECHWEKMYKTTNDPITLEIHKNEDAIQDKLEELISGLSIWNYFNSSK